MILRYLNAEGKQVEIELGSKVLVLGRSLQADICIPDDRISRYHCEVRLWDEEYVLKDLKSRNGTFLNDQKVEVATLHYGDTIRIGSAQIKIERKSTKGAQTILREVSQEMDQGKGYRTILREIVKSVDDKPKTREG
jgi:pSer/pThr/pTyr-binding forkhead associated (FHA) protein